MRWPWKLLMREEEAHAAILIMEGHYVSILPTDVLVGVFVFWDMVEELHALQTTH